MKEVLRVLKPGASFIIIGEPTAFGASAINTTKLPLVLLNRTVRFFKNNQQNIFKWDHDNIDVHDFTKSDAKTLLKDFKSTRTLTQGFLEPIIDQSILTPIRHILGNKSIISKSFAKIKIICRFFDILGFNVILPKFMRVTLKISGKKPV